jgi:hypothetical protein
LTDALRWPSTTARGSRCTAGACTSARKFSTLDQASYMCGEVPHTSSRRGNQIHQAGNFYALCNRIHTGARSRRPEGRCARQLSRIMCPEPVRRARNQGPCPGVATPSRPSRVLHRANEHEIRCKSRHACSQAAQRPLLEARRCHSYPGFGPLGLAARWWGRQAAVRLLSVEGMRRRYLCSRHGGGAEPSARRRRTPWPASSGYGCEVR